MPNRIRRISEEEIIVVTQSTHSAFGIGLCVGMLLGALVGGSGVLYGLYDESHKPDKKPAVVIQEGPTPAWVINYNLNCTGTDENIICKDVETGCQYLWPSFGVGRTMLTPRLNTQGKPMCGGTQ